MSVDPLAPSYPWYTPYQFAGNMPIEALDLDGLEPLHLSVTEYESHTTRKHRYKQKGPDIVASFVDQEWVYSSMNDDGETIWRYYDYEEGAWLSYDPTSKNYGEDLAYIAVELIEPVLTTVAGGGGGARGRVRMGRTSLRVTKSRLNTPVSPWKSGTPRAKKDYTRHPTRTAKSDVFRHKGVPSGVSNKIDNGNQARHLKGSPANNEKGYLNSNEEAQEVLTAIREGRATYLGQTKNSNLPVFRYDKVTGTNVNSGAGVIENTNNFILKGTKNPSIVPTSSTFTP